MPWAGRVVHGLGGEFRLTSEGEQGAPLARRDLGRQGAPEGIEGLGVPGSGQGCEPPFPVGGLEPGRDRLKQRALRPVVVMDKPLRGPSLLRHQVHAPPAQPFPEQHPHRRIEDGVLQVIAHEDNKKLTGRSVKGVRIETPLGPHCMPSRTRLASIAAWGPVRLARRSRTRLAQVLRL